VAVTARATLLRDAHVAYRRVLVPLAVDGGSAAAVSTACRLAADYGATVTALAVVEVPAELPLEALMTEEEAVAQRSLAEAEAIGDAHGVKVELQIGRAHV